MYGATRWMNVNTNPVIQVTDRNKNYNFFWFTFYHVAHLLLHKEKNIFLEDISDIKPDDKKEKEADGFTVRSLLSEKCQNEIQTLAYIKLKKAQTSRLYFFCAKKAFLPK